MSIPSWVRIGAKIVCIDAEWKSGAPPLTEGGIYTIRDIIINTANYGKYANRSLPSLILCELWNYDSYSGAFVALRFRPLITKTAEEDAAMIRRLVDEMDVMSRADRYLELLNQD